MTETAVKKQRDANLELLRIVAMVMIIVLHYLGKGQTLIDYSYMGTSDVPKINILLAWVFEALSYGATNIYVLISGYFSVNASFKMEKGIKLWLQVFFYSGGIALLYYALGRMPSDYAGIYWKGVFFTPIASGHYWFATTYLLFLMAVPFLSIIPRKVSRKNLLTIIVVMMIFFSKLWKDILPFTTPIEGQGVDLGWFATLFLIAAYLRLYVPKGRNKFLYLGAFFGTSALLPALLYGIGFFAEKTGHLENFTQIGYHYNSILVTAASVAIFLFFREVKIKEGFVSKAICKIAGLTFGIYLIHEHVLLRPLWTTFWHVKEHQQNGTFLPHMIVSVLCVFVACALIEYLRQLIFGLIYKLKPVKALFEKLSFVDKFFPKADEDFKPDEYGAKG